MRRIVFTLFALATYFMALADVEGAKVDNIRLERNGNYMVVEMDVDLSQLKVKSNRAVLLTPAMVNGQDSLNFASVGLYGRQRYFYYVRDGKSTITGKSERSFRPKNRPDTVVYHSILPYQEWMEGAKLVFNRSVYGCCNTKLGSTGEELLGSYFTPVVETVTEKIVYNPTFVYLKPQAEGVKHREVSGQAFVDFPVNQTVIAPDYRNNAVELQKIISTIDNVKDNSDVTITALTVKGYASPEGSYKHNSYLAQKRTEALVNYVQSLEHFEDGIISTSYEAEDWESLRRYVVQSNLKNRESILAIIDSPQEPDVKDRAIRASYPEDYQFLLKFVYPTLRHSDYKVEYTVRSYSNIEDIKQVMATAPQNLSLEEFYLVANSYEPGSDEHHEVFEIAVRMFPNDEIANLNAANSAMQKRDMTAAERYLNRAGDSSEAVYARGAYAALMEDYQRAKTLFKIAEREGVAQASIALVELEPFLTK